MNKTSKHTLMFALAVGMLMLNNVVADAHPGPRIKIVSKSHPHKQVYNGSVHIVVQPHAPVSPQPMVYKALPPHARRVHLAGRYYYHSNHVFYQPYSGGGYISVKPPEVLPKLPNGTLRVVHNGAPRYYYNGLYFQYTPRGYIIL